MNKLFELIRNGTQNILQFILREPQNNKQLINMLRRVEQHKLLDPQALAMMEGVLEISEMQVRDIMIPRAQMIIVEQDTLPREFLPMIIESGHSRFPVVSADKSEIIGILLAKDLLSLKTSEEERFQIRDILRSPVFVPESKRLNILLQDFKHNRNHMAIVIDEYGGIAGLVTIEDVLEQIVGEIEDEYDIDDESFIKQHSKTQFIVKAITPIEEFNQYFHSDFKDEEFDTIGGLITHALGHLPKRGETIKMDRFRFKIIRADKRRIHLLRVFIFSK